MGIVHHASYLRYLEIARLEMLREKFKPYNKMNEEGLHVPVLDLKVQYLYPARFDDLINIELAFQVTGPASFYIHYLLKREEVVLLKAWTRHTVIDEKFKPKRLANNFNAHHMSELPKWVLS